MTDFRPMNLWPGEAECLVEGLACVLGRKLGRIQAMQMVLKLHKWMYLVRANEKKGEPCGSPAFTLRSNRLPQSHWSPPESLASCWLCHGPRLSPLAFTSLAVPWDTVVPGLYVEFILCPLSGRSGDPWELCSSFLLA